MSPRIGHEILIVNGEIIVRGGYGQCRVIYATLNSSLLMVVFMTLRYDYTRVLRVPRFPLSI